MVNVSESARRDECINDLLLRRSFGPLERVNYDEH